jgi:hypothetical protein
MTGAVSFRMSSTPVTARRYLRKKAAAECTDQPAFSAATKTVVRSKNGYDILE